MRHLNYRRTLDTTLFKLNAQLNENALVLPETVGYKAESIDEEGIWLSKTLSNDSIIDCFV